MAESRRGDSGPSITTLITARPNRRRRSKYNRSKFRRPPVCQKSAYNSSVNTGKGPLVSFCSYNAEAGHNYGDIETEGFVKRVLRVGGVPAIK